MPAIKHPEYILFDTEWGNTASEQLHHALTDNLHQRMGLNNPGFLVANQMASRMSIGNEILLKSRLLGGTPLIDAPTSWKFFTFKLALDARQCEETKALSHLHITRAMNALAGKEFPWLGRIPHPALIELRQSGAIEEIRQIIGKGIDELTLAASMDFDKTTDRVFYNINNAFEAHQKAIKELTDKKWKFAGTHVTSWLAVGAIEITAAATGLPTWGLASVIADQLLPIPKLKDIPKQFAELANSSRELHSSPVGLFFGLSRSQS